MVSLSAMSMPSSWSTTLASTRAVGIMKRASFMWWLYVEPPSLASPFCPSDLIKGNTPSRTVSNSCSGAAFLKRDQRSLSWSAPKTGSSMGVPVRAALRSLGVCSSSSRLMKSR